MFNSTVVCAKLWHSRGKVYFRTVSTELGAAQTMSPIFIKIFFSEKNKELDNNDSEVDSDFFFNDILTSLNCSLRRSLETQKKRRLQDRHWTLSSVIHFKAVFVKKVSNTEKALYTTNYFLKKILSARVSHAFWPQRFGNFPSLPAFGAISHFPAQKYSYETIFSTSITSHQNYLLSM